MAQYLQIHPTHPQARLLRLAVQAVRDGSLIAYPTDSSYALGCRLDDAEAARRIRAIRALDERHHFTVMCGTLADAGRFGRMDNWQFRLMRQGVPGPFTFLLPASREVPRRVQHARRSTIGVRVSDHPVVQGLLAEMGGPILTSTLLLPGDERPLNEAEEIRRRLASRVDLILDAGACPNEPTTVVDLAVDPPVVVRLGRGDPARLGLASGESTGTERATRVK
jgi:tRNA threonylcarbamoyl adenosine modification protein (Sua5/YciO/YrdC/YwlC family)